MISFLALNIIASSFAIAGETVVTKSPAPANKIVCDELKRESLKAPVSKLCARKNEGSAEGDEAYLRARLPVHYKVKGGVRDQSLAGLRGYIGKYRKLIRETCERKKTSVENLGALNFGTGTFSTLGTTLGTYSKMAKDHSAWIKENTEKLNAELRKDEERLNPEVNSPTLTPPALQPNFSREFYGNWVSYGPVVGPLSGALQNESMDYDRFARTLDRLQVNAVACEKSVNTVPAP